MTARYRHLYYLASPYTHPDPKVMSERARIVTKAAVDLLKQGIYVFAPIAYNAPWERYELPGNWEFWQHFDKAFVSRMDAVVVLKIDGWDESVGVTAEIEFAKSLGIPVKYITLSDIKNNTLDHLRNIKNTTTNDIRSNFEGKL